MPSGILSCVFDYNQQKKINPKNPLYFEQNLWLPVEIGGYFLYNESFGEN